MLKIKNVTKCFGDIKALDNVSFEVGNGELVFIIGPSGAGKTTLLRLILREILPDSGEIFFEDKDVSRLKPKEIPSFRQKIGMVFQDYKILPERTLRENVEVALAVINLPQKEWKARVEHVLGLVELSQRADLFPSQLSGGELQRAALARALVVNPKVVLADEPTGNLDWDTAERIMELFEKINQEGKTIIMATHHRLIVEKHRLPPKGGKLKRRAIELKEGKIISKEKLFLEETKKPEKAEIESQEEKPKKMKVKVEEV